MKYVFESNRLQRSRFNTDVDIIALVVDCVVYYALKLVYCKAIGD